MSLSVSGMPVMATMVCCPPKRTPLTSTAGDETPDELHESTGFKRTMRKITMIKGSNIKHPNGIGKQCQCDSV